MNSSTQRPKGLSQEEIIAASEKKAHVDFVYQTNQTLQKHSQSLIGLSLSYEKKVSQVVHELKMLEIKFHNLDKDVRKSIEGVVEDLTSKIDELLMTADEIYQKTDEIYNNFATLDDAASIQLSLEEKIDALEKRIAYGNAYVDTELSLLKGKLQTQIDDLKRFNDQPDLGHQQCELSLQIKRDEDAVTIKGLQTEINRLKKQCDYNQKQFEYVVNQLKKSQE